ncbi:hypothetical protein DFH09DRAFT_1144012 [Mycena vulgaris]|nr:hypothetical protein DFH09DRAFT_1144012 [Mycena vulgaris]
MSLRRSPFAAKLRTNYVPSDNEIQEIRALLLESLDELARLDTQIDEAQAFLHQLRVKRQSLKAEIDAHTALTLLVRRLPEDILQEIFLSCLPSNGNAVANAPEAPLLLGFICRHWRSVALSIPRLWSAFTLWTHKDAVGLIENWLSRAGICPLTISLGPDDRRSRVDLYPGIEHLIDASGRIHRLEISGAAAPRFLPLLQLAAENFPVLASLTIHTSVDLAGVNILQAPGLRHVSLSTPHPLTLPLLWEQLTELALHSDDFDDGVDLDGALEVLFRCTNLVQCYLEIERPRRITAKRILALPSLQHLTLIFHRAADPLEFVECLSFPNLRHLTIARWGHIVRPFTSGTPSLFADLSLELFTHTTLLSLFALLPQLTQLRLTRVRPSSKPPMDDVFLSRLRPTAERPSHNLCPLLTHFQIKPCAFSDSAVLDFILAHSIHGSPLQRVEIDFQRAMDIDIFPELQPLISEGLSVNLTYLQ